MTSTIRFKFRAELSYSNLPFDGHYITVGELKRLIAEKKGLGIDAANELQLTDATSKRDYDNDVEQVLKNSAVIVKRVASAARPKTIISSTAAAATAPAQAAAPVPTMIGADLGIQPHVDDEFGEDPLSKAAAVQHEEQQMVAFLNQAAKGVGLEGQLALQSAVGRGRGRGRGFGPGAGRGGRGLMMNRECNRCGQVGHFWSECPTQGDPAFDREKRKKVPSGIPASKIQRNADGSLYLPDGELGELAANTQAFNKLAALMGRGPAAADASPNAADGVNVGASGSQVIAPPAAVQSAPAWQQPGRAAADAAARSSAATQQQQLQQQQQQLLQQQLLQPQQQLPLIKQEVSTTPPPTDFPDATPPPDAASADIATGGAVVGVDRNSPAVSPAPDMAMLETKPAVGHDRNSVEPQLFDDDFEDGAKHPTHMQPVKLALGMMEDPSRRSLSPAPYGPTGPREGGMAATAAAADVELGRGQGYEDAGADDDGVPAALRRVGCSRPQLEQALPYLRGLLPGAITIADVFRAFGSGRPLTRREFHELQAAASRPAGHRGSRREIGASGRHLDASECRDRDPYSGRPLDRERSRRSHSRGRRSKRSRSGGSWSRSRSRSRSPSSSKRRRPRSDVDDRDRSRGRDRDRSRSRDRDRSRGRDYERGKDRERERDRERKRTRDGGRYREREREDVRREALRDKEPSGQPRVSETRRKRSRSPVVADGVRGGGTTGVATAGANDPDGSGRERVKTERQTPSELPATDKASVPVSQPADVSLRDADAGDGEGHGVQVTSSARDGKAETAPTRTVSSVPKDGAGLADRQEAKGNDEAATDKAGRQSRSPSPNRNSIALDNGAEAEAGAQPPSDSDSDSDSGKEDEDDDEDDHPGEGAGGGAPQVSGRGERHRGSPSRGSSAYRGDDGPGTGISVGGVTESILATGADGGGGSERRSQHKKDKEKHKKHKKEKHKEKGGKEGKSKEKRAHKHKEKSKEKERDRVREEEGAKRAGAGRLQQQVSWQGGAGGDEYDEEYDGEYYVRDVDYEEDYDEPQAAPQRAPKAGGGSGRAAVHRTARRSPSRSPPRAMDVDDDRYGAGVSRYGSRDRGGRRGGARDADNYDDEYDDNNAGGGGGREFRQDSQGAKRGSYDRHVLRREISGGDTNAVADGDVSKGTMPPPSSRGGGGGGGGFVLRMFSQTLGQALQEQQRRSGGGAGTGGGPGGPGAGREGSRDGGPSGPAGREGSRRTSDREPARDWERDRERDRVRERDRGREGRSRGGGGRGGSEDDYEEEDLRPQRRRYRD